ncbi:hypothetical protein [Aquitalea sp.]|uniref:hypothetical protein n=1 Tax=Aquitalea sp. TaxID=1872623 RepID=UPI0025834693|nr:hypothetical protein [Aquitalea sp.]
MSTTLRHSAIAIVMLSSILCTSATSHADTLKSEKIYFSNESIDQLKDWINSNKPTSKEIKIGNFNIPLPPGEWKPLPGGLETESFIVSKNQIGIELYTATDNPEQMPDYMLSITASQSIPFTYLPNICNPNNTSFPGEMTISTNAIKTTYPNLNCHTLRIKFIHEASILTSSQLYSKDNNNISISYIKLITDKNGTTGKITDKEKSEIEIFKQKSNDYLEILNKTIGPLFQ